MKKNGFTLVELLAAIIILGILTVVVLPDIIEIFDKSEKSSLKVQENQLMDAAALYFQDYCVNPINTNYIYNCNYRTIETYYEGNDDHSYIYICSSDLKERGYIDDIYYDKNNLCEGFAVLDYNLSNKSFSKVKGYLACGPYGKQYLTRGQHESAFNDCGTGSVYFSSGSNNSGSYNGTPDD